MTIHSKQASGKGRSGFTLLEVLIALAILTMAMTVILGRQSNILQYSHYIRRATLAAQIARTRLADIEHVHRDDCFETEDGVVFDDECGEEGLWKEFRCTAICLRMEATEDILEEIKGQVEGMVEGLAGGDAEDMMGDREQLSGTADVFGASFDPAMIAQAAGMLTSFIPTFIQLLDQKVRKVTLTVTWREGRRERVEEFTQYIVNTAES